MAQQRVRLLVLGAVIAALAAFSTAIEYGLATPHDHAALASDGTAMGVGRT